MSNNKNWKRYKYTIKDRYNKFVASGIFDARDKEDIYINKQGAINYWSDRIVKDGNWTISVELFKVVKDGNWVFVDDLVKEG